MKLFIVLPTLAFFILVSTANAIEAVYTDNNVPSASPPSTTKNIPSIAAADDRRLKIRPGGSSGSGSSYGGLSPTPGGILRPSGSRPNTMPPICAIPPSAEDVNATLSPTRDECEKYYNSAAAAAYLSSCYSLTMAVVLAFGYNVFY